METWKEFDQNIITHSAAHHLMAIDDLMQKRGYARVSDVARQLNITRGSVSISLQPLKKAGFVLQDENRHLRLSDRGQELVDSIKTKRRLVRRLFAEVLGVDPTQAEVDACKMEHLISRESALRLNSFLRYIDSDEAAARKFDRAWREYEKNCHHDPAECPSCDTDCLADTINE